MALSVMYSCCAGLDVHKETVVSCILLTAPSGKVSKEIRTFGTTTSDLQMLSTWLSQRGVTHVALESTGVYWRPRATASKDAYIHLRKRSSTTCHKDFLKVVGTPPSLQAFGVNTNFRRFFFSKEVQCNMP